MQKHPDRAITNEEAYQQFHDALLALEKRHGTNFMTGPNFAETVRLAGVEMLSGLMMTLIIKMDGTDPESLKPKKPKAVTLTVPIRPETLDALRKTGLRFDESPEMAAARVLETWMLDDPLD